VVRVSGYRSRGPRFDSRPYQIFWQVRGLERGPLSLVITTEELLEKRSSGSGLENPRLTAVGIRCADHVTPSTHKSRHYFADSGGLSVGIVRLRTKATEFSFLVNTLCRNFLMTKVFKLWNIVRHDLGVSAPSMCNGVRCSFIRHCFTTCFGLKGHLHRSTHCKECWNITLYNIIVRHVWSETHKEIIHTPI
jgi:hypothetical protein